MKRLQLLAAALLEAHLLATAGSAGAGFSIAGLAPLSGNTGVGQVIGDSALAALDAVDVAALAPLSATAPGLAALAGAGTGLGTRAAHLTATAPGLAALSGTATGAAHLTGPGTAALSGPGTADLTGPGTAHLTATATATGPLGTGLALAGSTFLNASGA